jgi:hypothetical protein
MSMAGGTLHPGIGETIPLPRARIAMTRPGFLQGKYLFELIAVDGAHPGQRLAHLEVGIPTAAAGALTAQPRSAANAQARAQLRAIGREQGYTVTDF